MNRSLFIVMLLGTAIFLSISPVTGLDVTFQPPRLHTASVNLTGIDPMAFVSLWDTTYTDYDSSDTNEIFLPITSTGTYNFTVDWGDNTTSTITDANFTAASHEYAVEGEYLLIINGTIDGFCFADGGDKYKIMEIAQWGSLKLGNDGSYFHNCANLIITATDAPDLSETTNLFRAFSGCYSLSSGSLNNWNTSLVTSMEAMFANSDHFNMVITEWDVSSVTTMSRMFYKAEAFNQDITEWDVSGVLDFSYMFFDATSVNLPLGYWNVSSATDMSYFLTGGKLSVVFYSSLINSWASLPLQSGVTFDAGSSKYADSAKESRQYIIDTYNWIIKDGGNLELVPPEVNSPEDILYTVGTPDQYITWEVGDANPANYFIILNDTQVAEGEWTNGTIIYNITGWEVGSYTVKLYIFDDSTNYAIDTVNVKVVDVVITVSHTETSSTTSTTSQSNTDDTPYWFSLLPFIIITIKRTRYTYN
ncbi:MAG: DUF285 domain-containing protein [Candidatus Heimdallarchaeota archaeon]|nr:DUF285 domain-containing protein [Candidatus Heimdallarchaeota archaeon]